MSELIRCTSVCKDYDRGAESVRVLDNVDFAVEAGAFVALMGPSGSGKTTLLNLIGGLDARSMGCGASEALAEQYGWRPGDAIPIMQDIFPQDDGSWTWQFELAGTFEYPGGELLLINYDFFNEAVAAWGKDQVGWLVARVTDAAEVDATIRTIDGLFENSSDPTRSTTEDEYRRQFASQLGDIGTISSMILVAVFFTIILLTGNTAAQAFAERIPELAAMKTLGFSDRWVATLVLAEATALCVCGGAAGVGVAFLLEPGLNASLSGTIGSFELRGQSVLYALGLSVLLGLVVGAYPAVSARRLSIIDALRER